MIRTLAALVLMSAAASAQGPVEVEPADLNKRNDLIGREVVVDDRVKFFFPVPGKEPEIIFARTDVTVVLPPNLHYNGTPSGSAARARGILKKREEGGGLYIEATALPLVFRSDLRRLNSVASTLSPQDADARAGWGEWAYRRAEAFHDQDLRDKAEAMLREATEIISSLVRS